MNLGIITQLIFIVFLLISLSACAQNKENLVIEGNERYSLAPHGKGNVYAPEIIRYKNKYYLYYGAQGKDGHDRIQLAISNDAKSWERQGVVFFVRGANHVNDPSIVLVNNNIYMYYTIAINGVTDSIGLAISKDGLHFENIGTVLSASKPPKWDSLLVGRPSVIYEQGKFRMWFDGRADLPIGSPDSKAPKSANSHRYVGYAESLDGINWKKRLRYVFGHDAGGIHVAKVEGGYTLLFESRKGTQWASSKEGYRWTYNGVFLKNDMNDAPYGHVTPFLFHNNNMLSLYFGAARAHTWDNNSIMMRVLKNHTIRHSIE